MQDTVVVGFSYNDTGCRTSYTRPNADVRTMTEVAAGWIS